MSGADIRQQLLKRLQKQKRRRFSLRMAPLIDVIFLLLIFFVLTAKFRAQEQFLPIKLGDNDAEVQSFGVVEPLEIYIASSVPNTFNEADYKGCAVQIAGLETIPIEDVTVDEALTVFANKLTEVFDAQKRTPADPIEITCDDDVSWDYLVKIYNVLYAMGAADITFAMTE